MKVRTKNSVYDVETSGQITTAKKIEDNHPNGQHPHVKLGDEHSGELKCLEVGKSMTIVRRGGDPFLTSEVTSIEA